MRREWRSVELSQTDASKFRSFLRKNGIKYEPSACGNMVHFEVLVHKREENICNDFLSQI